jgi:hypothetical protein
MIGVLSIGRLGNQLFQYAFALELSRHLKTSFFIKDENTKHKFYADRYFNLTGFNRYNNTLRKLSCRNLPIYKIDSSKLPSENLCNCKDGVLYHGFYQSTFYFNLYQKNIRQYIKVKEKYIEKFNNCFNEFFQHKNLVIHVRGTDYKNTKHMLLPSSYYHEALRQINNLKDYQVWLVTDDFPFARTLFPKPFEYRTIQGSEIDDFQLILNADLAIIANSSFAWWAAYLNSRNNKKVYVPKQWLGGLNKQYPNNIFANTGFKEVQLIQQQ